MKRSLLMIAALCAGSMAYGQSQRLCLFEEFTQASCGPCAATNPSLNAMLRSPANEGKIVAIKYQTNWPGTDPMNIQTQSWVGPRVSYYTVSGVPDGELDGNVFNDHPGNFTQAMINSRYAVPSPFTMSLTHTFSSDYDSIFINLDITCTQAVTGTNVKCRVALVEKDIVFCSAPGSNGETEFLEVMRTMYPDAAGTAVANSWSAGQTQNLTFSKGIPTYIYDKSQLAVVAFLQNDGTKEVYQASYSIPQPLANDAGFKDCSVASIVSCNTTFDPVLTLHNFGSGTMTSCTVNYQIDGGTVMTQPWTGSIAAGGTASVTLPTVTLTSGAHVIHAYTTDPNSAADYNTGNDAANISVTVLAAPIPAPITETFTAAAYPPAGWVRENVDGDGVQWARSTAGIFSAGSSKIDFYTGAAGTVDNLYPPIFDFSNVTAANAVVEFDLAHAQYGSTYTDRLDINISTDCGDTWTIVYSKTDPALRTITSYFNSGAWTPTAGQWRHEVVDLSAFIGEPSLLLQFKAISDYGNNLYVDNINITAGVGIQTVDAAAGISIFPNPSKGEVNLSIDFGTSQDVNVTVTNTIGAVVSNFQLKDVSNGIYPLNLEGQSKGNYMVSIKTNDNVITKRITITE